MVNGIGRANKLGKKYMQQPGFTNGTLNKTFSTLNICDESNENIYVGIK